MKKAYQRIVLKCSGEALMGNASFGIDPSILNALAQSIAEVVSMGVETGIVIGGGNLFRGKALCQSGLTRVTGDHMGMLATVMNGLALRDALDRLDIPVHLMSALSIPGVVELYDSRQAMQYLSKKEAVIFCAGIGNPLFTTDTTACLRGIEVEANIVLKATKVDGIYTKDPIKYADAVRFDVLSYQEVLEQGLEVMDLTAICLCKEHNMPLKVFDMNAPNVLKQIILGENVGTLVRASHD